ncbi:MAG: restriction endonuclease subunit S [Bacteroidetes bacterium]|nr:restriction endonuclease subunit S [Bacteroidota bacterium]
MEAKGKIEREKKEADLDKKLKAKKTTASNKSIELKTFDQILENRIQNEIAKRIDKAHNYSFNLANYKSVISDSQLIEWTEALKHIQPNGATTVEDVYKKLNNGKPENILPYLLKLNPTSALEADIAREYLSNLDKDNITKHKELNVIKEILKSKQKYPIEKIEGKVEPKYIKIKKENYDSEIDIVDKISFKDGKIHFREEKETGMDLYQAEKGDLVTSKINVHQGALALADRKLVCSTHYQVYEIDKTQINPAYLVIALKSKQLQDRVNEIKNGGIKNEQGAEFLMSLEIPLPSLDEQNAIVSQIGKQKAIIEGADLVLKNWEVDDYLNLTSNEDSVSNIAYVDGQIIKDEKLRTKFDEIYVGGENIESGTGRLSNLKTVEEAGIVGPSYIFKPGQIVYSKVRPNLQKCFFADFEGICSSDIYPLTVFNENVVPEYFARVLQSKYFSTKTQVFQDRAGMPKVNRDQLATINISLPDKEEQTKIVEIINAQIQILEGLHQMKAKAQKKINQILADVWGVEFVELKEEVTEEVEIN